MTLVPRPVHRRRAQSQARNRCRTSTLAAVLVGQEKFRSGHHRTSAMSMRSSTRRTPAIGRTHPPRRATQGHGETHGAEVVSDGNTATKNYYRRIAAEYAELDDPVVRAQMQLDRWWESQRDLDWEEDDIYYVGGFQEFHSKTPSFHKARRDRDWRIK